METKFFDFVCINMCEVTVADFKTTPGKDKKSVK